MNSRQVFHYHIAEATRLKNEIAQELDRMAHAMARAESSNHPISEEIAPGKSYHEALFQHSDRVTLLTKQIQDEMYAATNVLRKC